MLLGSLSESELLESLPLPEVDALPEELPLALSDDDDSFGTDSDTPLPPPPPPVSDELDGSPTLLESGPLAESELVLLAESDALDPEAEPELPLAESLADDEPPEVESLLEPGGTSLLDESLDGGSTEDESPDAERLEDWLADELDDDDALVLPDDPLADADDELLPGGLYDELAEALAELLDEPEELPELDPDEEPLDEDEPG